jgi:hypothetical protein
MNEHEVVLGRWTEPPGGRNGDWHMKPDSMLVEPAHLMSAQQEVTQRGVAEALSAVAESEPALASFIQESLSTVAGKLALTGAPTPVVQGSYEDVLAVVLTCVQALRRGHYDLWKDSLTGIRLAKLDPVFQAKTRRRKRTPKEGSAEQESA